jgi:hypothetical protein
MDVMGVEVPGWRLARLVGCLTPDQDDSPGAEFLELVHRDVLFELELRGCVSEEAVCQIVETAVPEQDYLRWVIFAELGAFEFLSDSFTGTPAEVASAGLRAVAEALVRALIAQ